MGRWWHVWWILHVWFPVCWLKLSRCFISRVQSVNMLAARTRLPVPDLYIIYTTLYIYILYDFCKKMYMYHMNLFNNHNNSPFTKDNPDLFPDPIQFVHPRCGARQCPNWTSREQRHKRHRNSWCRCAGSGDRDLVLGVKTQFGNDLLESDVLNLG